MRQRHGESHVGRRQGPHHLAGERTLMVAAIGFTIDLQEKHTIFWVVTNSAYHLPLSTTLPSTPLSTIDNSTERRLGSGEIQPRLTSAHDPEPQFEAFEATQARHTSYRGIWAKYLVGSSAILC